MGSESPNAVLYDSAGNALAVTTGSAIPSGTSALLLAGSDGTNARVINVDTSGRTVFVGAGTAGTPSGGVITIQGVSGGTSMPVSVTTSAADVSATGALGALNATVAITHPGLSSVGMQLAAGTLIGTIIPEVSTDGGATWNATFFQNPANGNITTSFVFGSSNTATGAAIVAVGGAGQTRVRVSAYTSGTANITVRASDMNGSINIAGGAAGSALPPVISQMGGSVTTAAPTYTTGTLNALSLTTAGALRIDGSGVTQPVSGTVAATQSGTWTVQPGNTANTTPWLTTINQGGNSAVVKAASTAAVATDQALVVAISPNNTITTTSTAASDTTATGSLAALNATVQVSTQGATTALVEITGTWVGTIIPQISIDGGTTWGNLTAYNANTFYGSGITANGYYYIAPAGAKLTRLLMNAYTSGTATITINAAVGNEYSRSLSFIADGSNVAGVTAASTAAIATQPALVTAFSPNSPLPSGTNTIGNVNLNGLAFPFLVTGNLAAGSATAGDPVLIGASDGTNIRYITSDTTGHLTPTPPVDRAGTGTIAALNAAVTVSSQGCSTVVFTVVGTWVATLTLEATVDGTNWFSASGLVAPASIFTENIFSNNTVVINCGGYSQVRIRALAYTSGTATVTWDASAGINSVWVYNNVAANLQVTSTAADTLTASSYPDQGNYVTGTTSTPTIDAFGNLQVRGTVLTDEGSFRDDFTGTGLTTAITGNLTFINGGFTVTGTGLQTQIRQGQYIKKTADAETLYVQVSSVDSSTSLTLVSAYTGTTGAAASVVSNWQTVTPSGGSIAVASSIMTLTAGTTASATGSLRSLGDYLPFSVSFYLTVSQRIINQTLYFGFQDVVGTPNQQAIVQLTGAVNTTGNFVTSFDSASSIQTTAFTYPNGGNSGTAHIYKIDLSANQATLSIDGIVVATNNLHLPSPYTPLYVDVGVTNGGTAPASSTTITVDTIFFENIDRVQIDNDFSGEPLYIQGANAEGVTQTGNPVLVAGSNSSNIVQVLGVTQDRTAMTAGTQTGVSIIGQSSGVGRLLTVNRFGYAVPGYQTLLATDLVEGTTVNSWLWTQSTTTMTIAQTTGVLTLNSGAITTINTDAIITSNKQFAPINQAPIACSFKALITQTTNAVNEIGFGAPTTNTAIITNGAFFRINSSGTIHAVTSFNGTETVSASLGTIVTTSYYMFIVEFGDQSCRFIMEDETGIPLVDTSVSYSLSVGQAIAVSHIPAFARVYVTGTAAGTAPQTKIASFQAYQFGINTTRPWSDQLGASGRGSNIGPTTFTQTLQSNPGTNPTAITPANTTVGYTTLGGEFSVNMTATSANYLGIFGYQVPTPYALIITEIIMPPPAITTALSGATATALEFSMMVASSSNQSTATGYRYPLGVFGTPTTVVAAGNILQGQTINFAPKTPITILPGQFVLILVKVLSGAATGTYTGSIFINGYFE